MGVTVTAFGGPLTETPYDGEVPATSCLGAGLACVTDGLGVGNDETSEPGSVDSGQRIEVSFAVPVEITSLHFLDLFGDAHRNDPEERAAWQADDGAGGVVAGTDAARTGYAFAAIAARGTDSITFVAPLINNCGQLGPALARCNNDFALAGIEVNLVSLPAAGWRFGSAFLGLW